MIITVKTILQDGYCSGSWLTFLTFLYSTHWQQSATLLECEEKHEGCLMSSPSTRLVHLSTYYCFIIKLFSYMSPFLNQKTKHSKPKKSCNLTKQCLQKGNQFGKSCGTSSVEGANRWQLSGVTTACRMDTHFTKCTLRCCAYLMWNKKKL